MLQSIRDHTQGWIAGVIISLLILSFAMWGIHSYFVGGGASSTVAKVNGIEITKGQLSVAYERLRRQFQMQFNNNLPQQAEAGLKQRALQALINLQVLKQASQDQNYRVSSNQIDNFLEGMPEFQVNGQFSAARFQQVLESSLYNTGDFLELIKTSLIIDQPRLGLMFTSFALPDEILNNIALVNQERNIKYAVLTLASLANQPINISNEQIQAYYKHHEDEFKTQEQASIEYVELSLKDLMAGIHPTDEMAQNYYNENSNSYSKKTFAQVKDQVMTALIRQQAEEKFADMREKLANISYEHPESLATTAKELGLTIKTSGLFTKEKGGKDITANNKVREVAFSNEVLAQNNNSDVIQVGDNAVVLRIKTHSPAELLALKTVEPTIINKLKVAEVDARIAQIADEIKQKLLSGGNPDQIAKQYHLTWSNLGYIGRHSNKVDSAILNAAFSTPKPKSDNAPTFATAKVPTGYAVVALYGVRDGAMPNDHKQYQVFAEQIQNTQGLMEYELYKESLMSKAKISTDN